MYEDEYFFISKPMNSPKLPFLSPDEDTANRRFRFEALPLGQKPLVFYNENRAINLDKGITSLTTDILFDGFDMVVRDPIREKLIDYDFPDLHIYPSIYIDDKEQWHEDYWYLTFTKEFDCWDRDKSDYNRSGGVHSGGQVYYNVFTYVFNEPLMQKTPLEQRLLFKMGGSLDAYIVAHQSILLKVFGQGIKNGAEYVKVSDY
jgi:hypothetical protein